MQVIGREISILQDVCNGAKHIYRDEPNNLASRTDTMPAGFSKGFSKGFTAPRLIVILEDNTFVYLEDVINKVFKYWEDYFR
jgi:hypothetical protein